MRIAFFGTPEVAATTLRSLLDSAHEVVCVVTQPDKPVGRGGRFEPVPVKKLALSRSIPVLQPQKISNELELLDEFKPDIIITCAYGQILKQNVLDYCRYGVINVHYSLLPKYRGSSPVQWTLMNGETVTGITIAQTELGLDTGDIILKQKVDIHPNETAGELLARLAPLGAELLLDALTMIEGGTAQRVPQNHDDATHFPMLKKQDGKIDFSQTSTQIHNRVRALNPWPVAFFEHKGEVIRLHATRLVDATNTAEPGVLVSVGKSGLLVQCGDGVLSLERLQSAGGKVLSFRDFLNGRNFAEGDKLD